MLARTRRLGREMTNEGTDEPSGWSGYARFTVDDLAVLQPGLTTLMPMVGQRYWKLYYAAKAGNWEMALYQLQQVRELMETGMITRPEYEKDLEAFIEGYMGPIEEAIEQKDWSAFEEAYNDGIIGSKMYHDKNKRPYIVWKVPDHPPPDLDFG
jgi:hypothetical protein